MLNSDLYYPTITLSSSAASEDNSHMIIQKIKDAQHFCTKLEDGVPNDTVMVEDEAEAESDSTPKQLLNNDDGTSALTSNAPKIIGVVVNGFHPQLSAWQINQTNIQLDGQKNLENKVGDAVKSCRSEENEKIRVMTEGCSAGANRSPHTYRRFSSDTSIQEIYSEVFENSTVPQVIATPGGRFGAWNREFLKVCGFTQSGPYASLTLFDLVVPEALPLLHQIFLTSLYEEFPGSGPTCTAKDENKQDSPAVASASGYNVIEPSTSYDGESSKTSPTANSSYLSLTVPCIEFLKGQARYFITLSLMYDNNPDKRCFHCILTSEPTSKVGKIFYIEQNELLGML